MSKTNPWQKLRGSSADRKAQIAFVQEKMSEQGRPSQSSRPKISYGTPPSDRFIPFWSYEIKLGHHPLLLRFVPGAYAVPPHVSKLYPEYQEGEILPNFVWNSFYHPNAGQFGVDVMDTRDTSDGNDLSIYLMKQGNTSIRERLMNYYNVVDYGKWHIVQNTRKKKEEWLWERCGGGNCNYCKKGYPVQVARPGYVALSPVYEESINTRQKTISRFCACGSFEPISVLSLSCTGCGYFYRTAEIDSQTGLVSRPLKKTDLYEAFDTFSACPQCAKEVRVLPETKDQVSVQEDLYCPDCAEPRRATIYDADVALVRVGKNTASRLEFNSDKFKGAGFQIRKPPPQLVGIAYEFDFVLGLGINLRYVSSRLNIPKEQNPFYQSGGGYEERN